MPAVLVEVLQVRIDRLCRRTGLPRPRLSEGQRLALRELFITAYAEAVAYDERTTFLEGVDNG